MLSCNFSIKLAYIFSYKCAVISLMNFFISFSFLIFMVSVGCSLSQSSFDDRVLFLAVSAVFGAFSAIFARVLW